MAEHSVEFTVSEGANLARNLEPVTFGVPFPRTVLADAESLRLFGPDGSSLPIAATPLAKWPDGSLKWVLLDTQLSVPALSEAVFSLASGADRASPNRATVAEPLTVEPTPQALTVRSGPHLFEFPVTGILSPFHQVKTGSAALLDPAASRIALTDSTGRSWFPSIETCQVEASTPLRCTVCYRGPFVSDAGSLPVRFICRISLFAGKLLARIHFTVWNPQAAQHPGGVWDLGSGGSFLFRDLAVTLKPVGAGPFSSRFASRPSEPVVETSPDLLIYQDSSGGENWRSHNHVNRDEAIPLRFQGYEIRNGDRLIEEGKRATPTVALLSKETAISLTIRNFWENFPKALEVKDNSISAQLFPRHFSDLFELQGGEQKTHEVFVHFQADVAGSGNLDWIHAPLLPVLSAEYYHSTKACPKPLPQSLVAADPKGAVWQKMIDVAIQPGRSFRDRREIIDEYGWRNFGDLYADHEAVFHQGAGEFVSHYNNQYDVIKGSLIQFMGTGNPSWFSMADELAHHVMDIDIYHTDRDRYRYNQGLFWHTDHHLDAGMATHRTHSKKHWEVKPQHLIGGGPAPDHNYATGLLYNYWLTGNPAAKEAVLCLAQFVTNTLDGPDDLVQAWVERTKKIVKKLRDIVKRQPGGFLRVYGFDGPSRVSGNSLQVMLDAYLVSTDGAYLRRAEQIIRRGISPNDVIARRALLNAEIRWMYTIFLQALGRFCDVKLEIEEVDAHFWYARSALLKYALWMAENEYPYMDKPEQLEFPNETWSAQEIRKSDVLAHAAYYAPAELRPRLLDKSRYFFDACIQQLTDYGATSGLTRIIALLMSNGYTHLDIFNRGIFCETTADKGVDFGVAA